MALELPILLWTRITAVSYAAAQYRAAALNSSSRLALPAAGALIVGVVQNKPAIGDDATVMSQGITLWEASAAIAAGAYVAAGADGRCATATTGQQRTGVCVDATTGAGQYAGILLGNFGAAP